MQTPSKMLGRVNLRDLGMPKLPAYAKIKQMEPMTD